jgi:hypothetical protein
LKAWSLIRSAPVYRRDAFIAGLRALEYDVVEGAPTAPPRPGDLLVMWNRYYANDLLAEKFEEAGGKVLVAENGYVRGRHDGGDYYALAVHGHNGSGAWTVGEDDRWSRLGVTLKPLQEHAAGHVLVAPNRPFGMRGFAMPNNWGEHTADALRARGVPKVRLRPHPGNNAPAVPLQRDLNGARAVVIWSSSAGVRALIEGVPVVCAAPYWVCKRAALDRVDELSTLSAAHWYVTRLQALRRLAWAQWSIAEIARGEPFRYLMSAEYATA